MKVLHRSTLIFWLLFFCLGIIFPIIISQHLVLLLVGFLIFIVGAILIHKYEKIGLYIVFSITFYIIGIFRIESNLYKDDFNKEIHKSQYYVGVIKEQLTENKNWNSYIVLLKKGRDIRGNWNDIDEKVLMIYENKTTKTFINDVVMIKGYFNLITNKNNPGEFNSEKYWISKHIRYQGFIDNESLKLIKNQNVGMVRSVLFSVRRYFNNLIDEWVSKKDAPIIKAVLLGNKGELDSETKRAFTNTGAMHMLAVSGMHVGIISMVLSVFFKFLFFYQGKRISSVIILIVLWFYAFITGFSASVTRAVIMFTIIIISELLKREYNSINSLSIAAFIILIIDPLSILDIGFQLSFLAMLGIFTMYQHIEGIFQPKNNFVKLLWQGTAIGLAAQIFTAPISLYYFKQFPNYFILSNLGIILLSGIILGLAIMVIVFGKIKIIALPMGWVLSVITSFFIGFIYLIEQIPGAVSYGYNPKIIWLILIYLIVFMSLYWIEYRRWKLIILLIFPLFIWLHIERFVNMNIKEWIIFNSKNPLILVNYESFQKCFYVNHDLKSKNEAKRIINDYQKIHPGRIEFIPLTEERVNIKSSKFSMQIQKNKHWIEIIENNNHYAFILFPTIQLINLDSNYTIISNNEILFPKSINISKGIFRKTLE